MPGRCSPVSLQPDNYEFPFEICLSGQNPETVQGIDDCFIRYILRAEVYSNTGDSLTNLSREIQVRKMHAMSLLREPSVSDQIPYKHNIRQTLTQLVYHI